MGGTGIVASESVSLSRWAFTSCAASRGDLRRHAGSSCAAVRREAVAQSLHLQFVYLARPDSVIAASVYESRLNMGSALARRSPDARARVIGVVIPIPDSSRPSRSSSPTGWA
jgi:glutamine phosphoribosylpyrophosphate amidotransferase